MNWKAVTISVSITLAVILSFGLMLKGTDSLRAYLASGSQPNDSFDMDQIVAERYTPRPYPESFFGEPSDGLEVAGEAKQLDRLLVYSVDPGKLIFQSPAYGQDFDLTISSRQGETEFRIANCLEKVDGSYVTRDDECETWLDQLIEDGGYDWGVR